MKVLVVNCGSSSLKYQLIDMSNENLIAKGICERIGIDGPRIKHETIGKEKVVKPYPMPNHEEALKYIIKYLTHEELGAIKDVSEIDAVGHRIVHGGEAFTDSVLITEEVIAAVEAVSDLAPLHNPANLIGIRACEKLMPGVPMVGVFDTAFHQTMPDKAYLYGIPYEYYKDFKVRRYGFHGTSHKYVSQVAADVLGRDIKDLKIVVCHLGNGASICAIDGGKSVDTSMGLTPLEGLIMGTRSGDIDPAIIQFLAQKLNKSLDEVIDILNKKSGVLGLSMFSSDFVDLENAVDDGMPQAILTTSVFCYRVAKYIGSYAAAMNGLDAVCFAGGLGENNNKVREEICSYLGYLGADVDKDLNNVRSTARDFSKPNARLRTLLIPTNEELMIARDTKKILSK